MNSLFIEQLKLLFSDFRKFDKKITYIFLSTAFLHIISWYFVSRNFFREYIDPQNSLNNIIEFYYWFAGDAFLLLVCPILIIKNKFKEKLTDYGFTIKHRKFALQLVLLFLVIFIPLAWFLTSSEYFMLNHPYLIDAKNDLLIFLLFEAGMALYIFSWEFFWRGFFLFGLEEKFGSYAVLIQMLPFVFLHFGKPFGETFTAIFGALILGMLAIKTRSFLYGFVLHFLMMFVIDVMSVLRFHLKELEYLTGSFLNIF